MEYEHIKKAALSAAVKAANGVQGLADLVGENQSTVSMWITRGQVASTKTLIVSEKTGVSVHDLRPDIYGPAPAKRRTTKKVA